MKRIVFFVMAILQLLPSVAASYSNDSVSLRNIEPPTVTLDKSLPVGTIDGSAGVSASGAATYTVPINVVTGEFGYAPSLQLVYNSQAGDGILGIGWNLTGLSSISRCGKTFYYDNQAEEVKNNTNDNLSLDGRRLLLVSGTNLTEGAVYNFEDDPTTKIVYHTVNSSLGFTVYLKDGSIKEFGLANNSFLGSSSNKWLWLLNKSTDLRGREIEYYYDISPTTNEFCISSIKYDAYRFVYFNYDSRPCVSTTYFAGQRIQHTKRLTKLSCYIQGTRINEYRFTYTQDGQYSKLTDITYYGNDDSHYNPIHLTYGGESYQHEGNIPYSEGKNGQRIHYGDFNGDGRMDFITAPLPNSYNIYSIHDYASIYLLETVNGELLFEKTDSIQLGAVTDIRAQDVDGDGISEIVISSITSSNSQGNQKCYGLRNGNCYCKYNFYTELGAYLNGDITGDGNIETLTFQNKKVYNLNGQVVANAVNINWSDYYKKKDFIPSTKFITDFNGNKKEDVIVIGNNNFHLYELSNDTVNEIPTFANNGITRNHSVSCCDFNGDGYTDIIAQLKVSSNNYETKVYLSNGQTFVQTFTTSLPNYIRTGDFNNDGKSDILCLYSENNEVKYTVGISNGASFDTTTYASVLLEPSDLEGPYWVDNLLSVADFDGDGRDEIGFFRGVNSATIIDITDDSNLLLTGVANGLGKVVTFNYQSSSNSLICTKDIEYTHSLSGLGRSINLVTSMETTDQNDVFRMDYTYKNPLVHIQGKGFLGFQEYTTLDETLGTETISSFGCHSAYYYPYLSNKVIRTLQGDSISTEFYRTYCVSNGSVHSKAFIPYTEEHSCYDVVRGIRTWTTQTIDEFGNPLQVLTSSLGGFGKKITTTYNNYTTGIWLIGQPATVTTHISTSSNSVIDKQTITYNSQQLPEHIVSYTYDGTRQVSEETINYYSNGNVMSHSVTPYASSDVLTTTYQYSGNNTYCSCVTDQYSQSTNYSYDAFGRLKKVTEPTGLTTTYTYDGLDRIVQEETNDTVIISTAWNWNTESSDPLYCKTVSGNDGSSQKTWYDAFGREVRNSTLGYDGVELKTDRQYDANGRLWRVSLPYKSGHATKWNSYTYDYLGRIEGEYYANGKEVSYTYSGNTVTSTEDGIQVTKYYNQRGELIKVTDPSGDVDYSLRADGQPWSITALGITTHFTYDLYGRQKTISDPSAGTRTFNYGDNGRLSSETDADGRSVTITYDSYGRVYQKIRPEMTTTYTYDNANRLAVVSSTNGTGENYSYDAFGRMATHKTFLPDGRFLQREYTYSLGSVAAVRYSNQSMLLGTEQFAYSYGNLQQISFNGNNVWSLQQENDMGLCTAEETGPLYKTYSYDSYGTATGQAIRHNTTLLQDISYAYNSNTGNLQWRSDNLPNITENFGYDNQNRLTSYGNNTVTYDGKGNLLTKSDAGLSLAYNHPNKPYAVTQLAAGFAPETVRYANQRIVYNSFECPDSIDENGRIVSFLYNADGERVKMKAERANQPTRYYVGNFYEEEHLNGTTTYRLYLGGDAYSAPAVYLTDGVCNNLYYIGRDRQGSITHITDHNGNLLHEYSYDPWGCLRNPATQQNYTIGEEPVLFLGRGYCGHEHLQDFGLINMNARLYDPVVGRFLSPDPYVQRSDYSQNFNRYSYCLNNPLKYTDPDGELLLELGLALVGGYIGGLVANHGEMNPLKWNYRSFGTYLGIGLGGAFGFVGGYGIANPGTISYAISLETPYVSLSGSAYTTGTMTNWKFVYGWTTVAGGSWYSYEISMNKNVNRSISDAQYDYLVYKHLENNSSSKITDNIFAPIRDRSVAYTELELAKKEAKEIEAILSKARKENQGYVYELRARKNGYYNDVRLGNNAVYLEKSEIWKIGQTTHEDKRYGKQSYEMNHFQMVPVYRGNTTQLLIEEKRRLYDYYRKYKHLPPGNKRFF